MRIRIRILSAYTSLSSAQPCYYDDDHMNHVGWLNCTECHPFLVNLSQPPATNTDILRRRDNGTLSDSIVQLLVV